MASTALTHEKIWLNKSTYDKAECLYQEKLAKEKQPSICSISSAGGSLAKEVAKARQYILQSLQCIDRIAALTGVHDSCVPPEVNTCDKENKDLANIVENVEKILKKLDVGGRSDELDASQKSVSQNVSEKSAVKCVNVPAKVEDNSKKGNAHKKASAQKVACDVEEKDEDFDLFGSGSENEDIETKKLAEERLAAYVAKKAEKPAVIAKSSILLDVKPWDDETDMKAMEVEVRKIQKDGLLWGAAKFVPVAYRIQKLQIMCVVEDEKISVDWLTEQIEEITDFVQSVDIAAFNKI